MANPLIYEGIVLGNVARYVGVLTLQVQFQLYLKFGSTT